MIFWKKSHKGGLILGCIFYLDRTQKMYKITVPDSDFAHFFQNETKLKIPSGIRPPSQDSNYRNWFEWTGKEICSETDLSFFYEPYGLQQTTTLLCDEHRRREYRYFFFSESLLSSQFLFLLEFWTEILSRTLLWCRIYIQSFLIWKWFEQMTFWKVSTCM